MKKSAPSPSALRVSDLRAATQTVFNLRPGADALKVLAEELGVIDLRKVSFAGHVSAVGDADWQLAARLGASVVQPCSVTLEPVTTRIDVDVARSFQKGYVEPESPETEMPEDDTIEPLGTWIDPDAVMREALMLHLPLYPRAPDAELGETVITEPGAEPLRDADLRPFAGLAALREQLGGDKKDD